MTGSLFVACERELQHLRGMLDRALSGQGQVCFITGEAGAGKTSLTTEFALRAQDEHSALLFAVGNCNAQTGIGDPYLPFREVLGQLTGDVENKLTQGAISRENAGRLQKFLNISGGAIVDFGPDLIDIFLPGAGLFARAGKFVARDATWVKNLNRLREQKGSRTATDDTARGGAQGMDQNRIFEQFTRVLTGFAEQRPLVILLDDLHWADESSTVLLFHLARRISSSRILVLGTYRPEDVAQGRGDKRHPLESVVNEIKRLHGDVHLPLNQGDDAGGRAFIDALLDRRPNRLGEEFRRKLLLHTRGQPLFTTELLNDMRSRGDLLEHHDGHLEEGPTLNWDALPARVEGVIGERISRISPEMQELLTVASVEGELFSAQVIARVQNLGERDVLHLLDKNLDQQHHLVREDSVQRVGRQRLSQYRFRHSLIQRFLYNSLGQSEREILHESIARELEAIYTGQLEEVAGQLARHYELAQLPDLAADHYLTLGNRAIRLFANEEAARLLAHGLALLESSPDNDENSLRRVKLQLSLGKAQWKLGHAPESMGTYLEAAATARKLNSGEYLAQAALGYDDPRFRFNFPTETAVKLLEEAMAALGDGDSMLRVRLVCGLVRAEGHRMNELLLQALVDQAIAMARRLDDPWALYTALQAKSLANRQPELIEARLKTREEILQAAARTGDQAPLLDAYVFRIDDLLAIGDIAAVDADLEVMQKIVVEVNEPFYNYCQTTKLAMRALLSGRFDEAEKFAQQGMECSQEMEVENAEGVYGMQMFSIRRLQGRLQGLAPVISHFINTHSDSGSWRPGLALIYSELGDEAGARAEFERLAIKQFADIPRDSLYQTCLSYLSDVCVFLGDRERARVLYELLLPFAPLAIVVGNSIACNGAASRNLGELADILSQSELAEKHFQHAIEFNARLQAWPWLARTQYEFGRFLLKRGGGADREGARALLVEAQGFAKTLGMRDFEQRIQVLAGAHAIVLDEG